MTPYQPNNNAMRRIQGQPSNAVATPDNPFPQTDAPQNAMPARQGRQQMMPPPGWRPLIGGPSGPTPAAPVGAGSAQPPMARPPVGASATPNPMNGGASSNALPARPPVAMSPAPPAGTPNAPTDAVTAPTPIPTSGAVPAIGGAAPGPSNGPMPPGMMQPPGVRANAWTGQASQGQGGQDNNAVRQRNFQMQQTGGNPQLRTAGRPMLQNRAPREEDQQSTQ